MSTQLSQWQNIQLVTSTVTEGAITVMKNRVLMLTSSIKATSMGRKHPYCLPLAGSKKRSENVKGLKITLLWCDNLA